MKVVIPGGSGQVGTLVARAFHARGDEVVVLSRSRITAPWRTVGWDARTPGPWAREIDGAEVVINLAGRNVNCRYSEENRRQILESRVASTCVVGEAIARSECPPRCWLQASTATIYSHRHDAANDEDTGVIGGSETDAPASWKFSIEVAEAWERALDEAAVPHTRKIKLRSAMVMSPDGGGIFDTLLRLVRFGLGGRAASGRQYISWIHDRDFVNAIEWLVATPSASGVYNLASPNPLPQAEFMRVLRKAWGQPLGLPATRWMLAAGALVLRTETELILKSRRVVPARLLRDGFTFELADWSSAAADLCARWRADSRSRSAAA